MYPPEDIEIPASIDDPMDNTPYADANGRKHLSQYRDPEKIRHFISNYYAVVAELDDWMGKILDTLDEQGLTDSTLVIFCSDHGEMLGSHGMREKNVFYEESAHVPMICRLPGRIPAGEVRHTPVTLIDVFATILDFAGVDAPHNHGRSWRPIFAGDEDPERGIVTEWHFHGPAHPNYMVRQGKWKYITRYEATGKGIDCLFDLEADPLEMNNLIGRNPRAAEHVETVKSLRETWLAWADRCDLPAEFRDDVLKRPLV
jgi:arylsulfatase A-like enzyme